MPGLDEFAPCGDGLEAVTRTLGHRMLGVFGPADQRDAHVQGEALMPTKRRQLRWMRVFETDFMRCRHDDFLLI